MSNALEKKLSLEPSICEDIHALAPAWTDIAKKLSTVLAKETGLTIGEAEVTIQNSSARQFRASLPSSHLLYTARKEMAAESCIISFSPDLMTILSARLLDEGEDETAAEPAETYNPTHLDLFLLEPIAHQAVEIISSTLMTIDRNKILSPLYPDKKGLSPGEIGHIAPDLTEIIFSFSCTAQSRDFSITLICPREALGSIGLAVKENIVEQLIDTQNSWLPRLIDTVHKTPLEVSVTLDSLTISVAECSRLQMGQVMELPAASIENLSINVNMGCNFQKIGDGRLGIAHNQKAVLLNDDIDETFFENLITCADDYPSGL